NPYLYKIGRSYHFNHQDTEDLMQDSFVDAYFNLPGFKHRASFKTWLFRIMLNNCYRKHQQVQKQNEISFDLNDNYKFMQTSTGDKEARKKLLSGELKGIIEHAVEQIPQNLSMVFSLRELNGLTVKE